MLQETQRYMRRFTRASVKTKASRFKKETNINIMILIMIAAFNISWFPYALLCIIKLFHSPLITPTATVFPLLFAKRLKTRRLLMANYLFIGINLSWQKYSLDSFENASYFIKIKLTVFNNNICLQVL